MVSGENIQEWSGQWCDCTGMVRSVVRLHRNGQVSGENVQEWSVVRIYRNGQVSGVTVQEWSGQ